MYSRVVVPLDGSPLAEEVLPYAEALAQRCNAELYLVEVVPLPTQVAGMGLGGAGDLGGASPIVIDALASALDTEVSQSKAYLERVSQQLKAKGLSVRWEVLRGSAASQIIKFAQEKGGDLIAISSHGRSGLSRMFFGSVADKVLRQSGLPVLVISPKGDGKGPV
ncbi:MAG: universal stress protein [Chloroflexi bacterium]|nr:universal stress protein [Chloroflexota bacterium]